MPTTLHFTDQRTFGHLLLAADGAVLPPVIAHIAPDPLESAFDPDVVHGAAARPPDAGSSGRCWISP